MGRLIRFELIKMIKDPRYIIAFILFFVLSFYTLGISNYQYAIKNPDDQNFYFSNLKWKYAAPLEKPSPESELLAKKDYKGYLKYVADRLSSSKSPVDKRTVATYNYCLKNNVTPQDSTRSDEGLFIFQTILENLSRYGLIAIMFFGAIVFSKEYRGGAFKLLCIQPFPRSKIVLSKYISACIISFFTIGILLLERLILNKVYFTFDDKNYPVFIKSNYLSSSLFSRGKDYISVPLWKYALFVAILLVLAVLAFNAISLFFSVAIKKASISVGAITLISFIILTLFDTGILSISAFNPYSLCHVEYIFQNSNTARKAAEVMPTFIDAVVCFTSYFIICLTASLAIIKHRDFDF